MLTGDREEPARAICDQVGIGEVYARLLPEDKLNRLRVLAEDDHNVLAVGDGINDALALREASVGIAMGAMGSDLAIESADIALMNNNLMNVPFVIDLARQTRRIIYQNLVLSIGISAVMIALSSFGVITALAGSVLHNLGAFVVLFNSSRILRRKDL
jgi:Cd2+/Zn2+-exporting ATPase/Cu+-exporting ATPase